MRKALLSSVFSLLVCTVTLSQKENNKQTWTIAGLPSSVRLDPTTNKIIEGKFSAAKASLTGRNDLLEKNWIYDGKKVLLKSARGEYISFQLVITNNNPDSILKGIAVEMPPFSNQRSQIKTAPEL